MLKTFAEIIKNNDYVVLGDYDIEIYWASDQGARERPKVKIHSNTLKLNDPYSNYFLCIDNEDYYDLDFSIVSPRYTLCESFREHMGMIFSFLSLEVPEPILHLCEHKALLYILLRFFGPFPTFFVFDKNTSKIVDTILNIITRFEKMNFILRADVGCDEERIYKADRNKLLKKDLSNPVIGFIKNLPCPLFILEFYPTDIKEKENYIAYQKLYIKTCPFLYKDGKGNMVWAFGLKEIGIYICDAIKKQRFSFIDKGAINCVKEYLSKLSHQNNSVESEINKMLKEELLLLKKTHSNWEKLIWQLSQIMRGLLMKVRIFFMLMRNGIVKILKIIIHLTLIPKFL